MPGRLQPAPQEPTAGAGETDTKKLESWSAVRDQRIVTRRDEASEGSSAMSPTSSVRRGEEGGPNWRGERGGREREYQ